MSKAYPRDIAVRVLTRVLSDAQPLDEALAAVCAETQSPARAWLQEVCSGTLRWKGRLDQAIDSVALKKKPSGWLRKVLLIAAYQLVVQERIQPGAVVSETVDEVRRKEGDAPAKFANALLRKISEHGRKYRELELPANRGDAAAWASLPEWLWKRLVKDRGFEWARDYARASLERPQLWLRGKNPEWKPDWAEKGPIPGSLRVLEGGQISEREGFKEGDFFVQDISSQTLIAEISQEVRAVLGNGALSAFDVCAAPGGKSVGLAWNGFSVSASDREEARLVLLRQTVQRLAPEIRVEKPVPGPSLDLVWVDSPCSGTGILRRHPDVRWLRREVELAGLLKVQTELLRQSWERVRPGGFLAYSVCSVLREEGPGSLERAGLAGYSKREWFLTPQTAPGGDGFWAALLQKPGTKS